MKHHLGGLRADERRAVMTFRDRVKDALGGNLAALRLFGSKAIGRSTAASDIDLLVMVKRYSAQIENLVIDVAFDVNLEYGVYISPRVIGKATFTHPVWRWTPFLRTVTREGIAV